MLRFFSRFLGVWAVAGALVVAIVDGSRSIAASALTYTRAADTWALLGGTRGVGAGTLAALEPALARLMDAPTAAILAVLGFLLLAAGRRRRRGVPGHEFAT
jgi:MYXO-CTERM domain-containing protein